MNKRILISQKDLKEFTSGVPRKVLSEVKLFRRMGYKPIVIAETIDKQIIKAAGGLCIKTWRWPFSGKMRRTFYLKQVEKKVQKLSPDLVLGHGDIIEQDILYLHNCVHFSYERQNSKQLPSSNDIGQLHSEILKSNKFKLLICNSKLMQRDLITRFNLDESKTAVVYPEYNQIQFNTLNAEVLRAKYRAIHKIDENEIVVGLITSGNFKKRNVSLLLDVASELVNKRNIKVKFVIAGKNKDLKYQERVSELGLQDCISFLPSINEVEAYYHMIDIFVLPAKIEEFGRSVLEAMACAKPVIISSYVGASELLTGKAKQLILNELTQNEFIETLLPLVESAELRAELGKHNCMTAKQYTELSQNEKLIALLKEKKLL